MTYAESERTLNQLRAKQPLMFSMAISHLMDVGIRHLTEDAVASTCAEIMQQDDRHSFMTNAFQCELIRTAGELAKFDHIHLLVYIARNVHYDVGDRKLSYDRMDELLRNCVDHIISETYQEPYDELMENCCFDACDFEALGIEHLIPECNEKEDA